MGEILRAVMEEACITSRPKFYSARMTMNSNGQNPQVQSTYTTMDKSSWFLLTSYYVGAQGLNALAATDWPWGLQGFNANLQLEDMQTRKKYYISPAGEAGPLGLAIGSYMASPVELYEYPCFAPGSRIKWTVSALTQGGDAPPFFFDICYGGIEFLMPLDASEYYKLDGG